MRAGFWLYLAQALRGPQATVATEWLKDLTATMPRGKFETEVEHVEAAIAARKAPAP